MRPSVNPKYGIGFLDLFKHGGPWTLVAHKGSAWAATKTCKTEQDAAQFIIEHVSRKRAVRVLLGEAKMAITRDPRITDIVLSRYVGLAIPLRKLQALNAICPPAIWLEGRDHGVAAWRYLCPTQPSAAKQQIEALAARFAKDQGCKCYPLPVLVPVPDIGTGFERVHFRSKSHDIDILSFEPRQPIQAKARLEPEADFVDATAVKLKPIAWLKKGLAQRKALTLIVGRPKRGKSTAVAYFAKCVTRGGEWYDGEPVSDAARGSVIMFETEDPHDEVVIPRLLAAGADIRRVKLGRKAFDLAKRDQLQKVIDMAESMKNCRLLILSPFRSFIPTKDFNEDVMRAKVAPLLEWAVEKDVAVFGVVHLDREGKNIAGSDVMLRVCRAAISFDDDPKDKNDDELARQRVMRVMASNTGKMGAMVPYDIEGATVTVDGTEIETSRIVFWRTIDRTAASNGDGGLAMIEPEAGTAQRIEAILRTAFSVRDTITGKEISDMIEDAGMTVGGTLHRVRKRLGIAIEETPGATSPNRWHRPHIMP